MKKDAKETAKAKKDSGTKNKLPAGTPSSKAKNGYGPATTTDPAVPNRAHTEM